MGSTMKKTFQLYALHGFLGLPQDWDFLKDHIGGAHLQTPELCEIASPLKGLWHWGQQFNEYVSQFNHSNNVLLGYSMGGRLALHALLDSPSIWQAAILISAHPGLDIAEEKSQRYQTDLHWAQRFSQEPWPHLIEEWNQQAIFQGHHMRVREESDFCRQSLCQQLIGWSLGNQNYLIEDIERLSLPILWVAGEQDTAYLERARSIRLQNPLSAIWEVPGAAHRIPWEKSPELIQQINQFIHTLDEAIYASTY
jgi:2-succinyl-6-hydroxy-2,4-cyclohexadiene-1-carboxylate synthase